jgi:hypothetical protein
LTTVGKKSLEQRPDGASGLGKCCGYVTLFQSRFEASFQRAVDATITDVHDTVHLPRVVDNEIIPHYLQSFNVFAEFDDRYQTAGEKQEEWAIKIKGISITNTVCKRIFGECFHAVLPPYIHRITKAIKDPRWNRFFTLRIIA